MLVYKTGRSPHSRNGRPVKLSNLQVLARSVGHGETSFRMRSSVFATPICYFFYKIYVLSSVGFIVDSVICCDESTIYDYLRDRITGLGKSAGGK